MTVKCSIDPNIFQYEVKNFAIESINTTILNIRKIIERENRIIVSQNQKLEIINHIKNLLDAAKTEFIKSPDNKNYKELYNDLNHLKIIFDNPESFDVSFDKQQEAKSFNNFISYLSKKFTSTFLDFILVKSEKKPYLNINQIQCSEKNELLNFLLKNKNKFKREIEIGKDIKTFSDFRKKILDKLGFEDLSQGSLYFIQPDLIRNFNNKKLVENARNFLITIKSTVLYFAEKYKTAKLSPQIYIFTDNAGGKNLSSDDINRIRNNIQKTYLNEFNNQIFVKLIIKQTWDKKLFREQRFLGSSNNVVFSSNIGFDFLALGGLNNKVIRGTNSDVYDAMSQEDLPQIKVQTLKKALIWEINDKSTLEKVRKIVKTGSISHTSQLSEQLSKHPLASKL